MIKLRASIKKHLPWWLIKFYYFVKFFFLGFLFSSNLTKLAQLFGTDKWGAHYYTQHYQHHFSSYKFKKIRLLEIGVGGYADPHSGGQSLRMWKKYFPFAKIFAIDIYDKKNLQEKRIKIFQGSQVDEQFLINVVRESGELDIIIDDGSHINEHVIKSFEVLFPHLKDGGIYVIEDLETSYRDDYGGDSKDLENPKTSMNFFKSLADKINSKEYRTSGTQETIYDSHVYAIHFYHNLIIIEKRSSE
jgi:demethylmacrocin O-methyltransferase